MGNPGTKRTDYFRQAAERTSLPVLFADWKDWEIHKEYPKETELFLKIDPPLWKSCSLEELNSLTGDYKKKLNELAGMAGAGRMVFLNHPRAIAELLDKQVCKERLVQAGLPVTERLDTEREKRLSAGKLLEIMKEKGICQVFIKPVNGSGAAGVSAFRWQPRTGRMALYTCALEKAEFGLINTKRLWHFSSPEEILPLLDGILALGCMVERWYAKEEYQGYSYDLRAVVQEGQVDFLLARLSKGPITNLHLNNRPMEAKALKLPVSVLEKTEEICQKAMRCFQGLRSAGIDILLEKGSLKPRIIEMNAQGDLIYQDIFNENVIYLRQAAMMKKWIGEDTI